MKSIAISLAFISFSAIAAPAKLVCKKREQAIDVFSMDGWKCARSIHAGDVCFMGDVRTAERMMNSNNLRDIFDAANEEFIENARVLSNDAISFEAVSDVDLQSTVRKMKRCSNPRR
jgi:hypothetical protein